MRCAEVACAGVALPALTVFRISNITVYIMQAIVGDLVINKRHFFTIVHVWPKSHPMANDDVVD